MSKTVKKVSFVKVMKRANELYLEAKGKRYGAASFRYTETEAKIQILSDQVKAMAEAIVEALNAKLG